MRLLLSYCKSHIYDIHFILAGTITFWLMFLIKEPVKALIAAKVNAKAEKSTKWAENKSTYIKMCNGILIPITMLLAFAIFFLLSVVSPLIDESVPCALMSGAVALAEYAVFEQMCIGGGKRG